ncbi:MAG: BTAD domain-containing putative transcriptional regulator, partial [Anaerolineales bacterium]
MPSLKLFLLGTPRVEHDGASIDVDTRKAIALLAHLAVASPVGPRRRDSLAAFFWPEVDESRAHGALRRTLSVLNKGLGGQGLRVERETVAFEPGADIWVDVAAFHACLAECRTHSHPATEVCAKCLPALAQAAELYSGDFMAGFSLRDSPAFDDWQFFQMEALRRELAAALERLARGESAQRNFEGAIAYARRWLALDPLHEPAHRQLMLLYAWAGQRTAGLRQYRECVRVLEQELGVAPLDETTQLYAALKENRPPAPPEPLADRGGPLKLPTGAAPAEEQPGPAAPHPASQRPLVGRQAEWAALLSRFAAAGDNGGL